MNMFIYNRIFTPNLKRLHITTQQNLQNKENIHAWTVYNKFNM